MAKTTTVSVSKTRAGDPCAIPAPGRLLNLRCTASGAHRQRYVGRPQILGHQRYALPEVMVLAFP